jgi:predicted dehydrogenase
VGKLKVGIIGTGFGTRVHVPGFQAHPETEVVALASVRPGRAAAEAARLSIPHAFDDWQEMLEAVDLDIVSVVTAPDLHYLCTVAALVKGRHVLCEKPFALNLTQAREMLALAQSQGVRHAINHEYRYVPARQTFKHLVASGFLGDITQVVVTWTNPAFERYASQPYSWLWNQEAGGGMLGALGSHLIDALQWWFGPIIAAGGRLDTRVRLRQGETGMVRVTADDSFRFLCEFASGAGGTVQFLPLAHHGDGLRVEAYGRHGTLVLRGDREVLAGHPGGPLQPVDLLPPEQAPGLGDGPGQEPNLPLFAVLVDRFVSAVRGRPGGEYPTFQTGCQVQAVLDTIRRSHQENRYLEVPEA